jgi:hypothetical protein
MEEHNRKIRPQVALLSFAALFENGEGRLQSDFAGLFEDAADHIVELRKAKLAADQYLAMAEGWPDGGLPGWTMDTKRYPGENYWQYDAGPEWLVEIERRPAVGWNWGVWLSSDEWNDCSEIAGGHVLTAREAVTAAMAAYEKARAGHVAASR